MSGSTARFPNHRKTDIDRVILVLDTLKRGISVEEERSCAMGNL
jgi:hypothetical protein